MALLARELDPTRMIVDESGRFTGASALRYRKGRVRST